MFTLLCQYVGCKFYGFMKTDIFVFCVGLFVIRNVITVDIAVIKYVDMIIIFISGLRPRILRQGLKILINNSRFSVD